MHGTGAFNAMWNLCLAGSVVTLDGPPLRRRRAARHHRARAGRSRCRSSATRSPSRCCGRSTPSPGAGTSRSLRVIVSSGVMWSAETKAGPAAPQPAADHDRLARLVGGHRHGQRHHDRGRVLGRPPASASDRTPGCSPTTGATSSPARASSAGWRCGAGRRSGTTRTPRSRRRPSSVIDGVRYSIPGDWAEVEADGTVKLLGRGQPVHQHRRREGLPRGGRGGAEAAPLRRRRRGRRPARRALRRGRHRPRRAAAGRDRRRRRRSSPT